MLNVVIIGFGNIGQALKKIIKEKNTNVEIWDKDFSKIPRQKPLKEIIPSADLVFLCVPSWSIRKALLGIKPYLKRKVIIISLAKGMERKTFKTAFEILKELVPFSYYGILSGPMIAKELRQGKGGAGVVAGKSKLVFEKVRELFSPDDMNLEYSADAKGTALAGVLKNIYTLGFGIVDGLGWSFNLKGWLTTQVFLEMKSITSLLGGKSATVLGIAGLGDLVATSFSPYSNHRRIGEKFAKTGRITNLKTEGLISLSVVISALLAKNLKKPPLLEALKDIFIKNKNPRKVFEELIN
jgi:glycerol-3-phosphate dehydrogenase (NAD(P)+)